MPIALYRIDDRLIHGQVVVGWGQPLELRFIVLVDDEVASSEWEQELYRMGVPPEMSVLFYTVADAAAHLAELQKRPEPGIVLVGDIGTMGRLVAQAAGRIGRAAGDEVAHAEERELALGACRQRTQGDQRVDGGHLGQVRAARGRRNHQALELARLLEVELGASGPIARPGCHNVEFGECT